MVRLSGYPNGSRDYITGRSVLRSYAASARRAGLFVTFLLTLSLALSAMAAPPAAGPVHERTIAAHGHDPARIVYPADRAPALALPGGGRQTIHSVLTISHVLAFGDYVWNDTGVGPGPVFIRVDLGRQLVSVFRGGHEIGTALVIYGSGGHPTPSGMLKVLGKDADHVSRKYNVPMAYTLWLTSDGIAIHASDVREGYATKGCVGVPIGFARRLFAVTRTGDKVGIVASSSLT